MSLARTHDEHRGGKKIGGRSSLNWCDIGPFVSPKCISNPMARNKRGKPRDEMRYIRLRRIARIWSFFEEVKIVRVVLFLTTSRVVVLGMYQFTFFSYLEIMKTRDSVWTVTFQACFLLKIGVKIGFEGGKLLLGDCKHFYALFANSFEGAAEEALCTNSWEAVAE